VRIWLKLALSSALLVLVLGLSASVVGAQTTSTTTICYPVETQACIDARSGGVAATPGLPRTGSSSSIPTAAIAAGMVGVGSVLAIAARRRSTARRPLN
jgi:LPXTG-motif cell wall-anchored protein